MEPYSQTFQMVQSAYEALLNDASSRIEACNNRREHYRDTESIIPGATAADTDPTSRRHRLKVGKAHIAAIGLVGDLVGEMPVSHVIARQESPEERWRADCIEKMLMGIYRESRAEVQFQSAGWHGTVLGAGAFKVWWDIGRNFPFFRSIKPENLLVRFATTGDDVEMDVAIYAAERTLASVARMYGVPEEQLTADRVELGTGRQFVTVMDYWSPDVNIVAAGGLVLKERENPYGFVPYVVVKNTGPNEYVWGFSDQEFYEGLAEYYNTLISQHADIIKLFSNPPVLARQTGLSAEAVLQIFREGGVVATNKERAELAVVQASGAPPEYQAQDVRVRELLQELTFGQVASGNALTGTALQMLGVGREALLRVKRSNWSCAQQKLNEYLLRMVEKLGTGKMSFSGVDESGVRSRSFYLSLDSSFEMPTKEDILLEALSDPMTAGMSDAEILASRMPDELNYQRLIDKHYATRVVWGSRTAKADPQFQLVLLNRFAQGAMSLRTFLEETGCEDVEREVERIRQEAEEMPWLRPQMAQFMQQQQTAMAGNGMLQPGSPFAGGSSGPGGSPVDSLTQMLGGGQGDVPGMPWGGA